jgi:hypothetical protein
MNGLQSVLRHHGMRVVFGMAFAAPLVLHQQANAQLFGNQKVGASASQLRSPLTPSGAPSGSPRLGAATAGGSGAGLLDGNERFVRGNRSRQEFVGTGRAELSGFVGAGQAIGVGRVPAATDSFRLETTSPARINRPLPKQPAKGMYYPRLTLDRDIFGTSQVASQVTAVPAPAQIQKRIADIAGANTEVFIAGGIAILRGTADSERAAELASTILSFEPGVDRVDNQLTVAAR